MREPQIRDEQPAAIGTLSNDAGEPFPAGSYQTMVQTYTVGEMGMAPGGGVALARHFISDHEPFQRDDPQADSYVTLTCSNPSPLAELDTHNSLGEQYRRISQTEHAPTSETEAAAEGHGRTRVASLLRNRLSKTKRTSRQSNRKRSHA